MAQYDIHVVGASAGGLEALHRMLEKLPQDLTASMFIARHISPEAEDLLPAILQARCDLPVISPEDKMSISPGTVYAAPPDRHLILKGNQIRIFRGPKENRHRPSVDVLFRSAAWSFGPRVVGVVLSGMLDDGVAGLWAIKTCGGLTIVQDPSDARYSQMPLSAISQTEIDYCLTADQIGEKLAHLSRKKTNGTAAPHSDRLQTESRFAMLNADVNEMGRLGSPSVFTCPSCHGTLFELQEGDLVRYRCHTGHAFGLDSLLAEQSETIEESLYAALRAIEEKASALRRIARGFGTRLSGQRIRLENEALEWDRRCEAIRQLLGKT